MAGSRTPAQGPLAHPSFRWFFVGRVVSLLGSSMAPVALTFAVLDASGSTSDLGIVLAARMVPMLGFLLLGGAVADRFSRRTVLVVANLGAALTQGGVAAVLLSHHYSLLVVAALEAANGTLDAFTFPALRGLLPTLVRRDQLRSANSLLGGTQSATKVLGPSISGLLVVSVGSGPAIAFDAVTFLAAGLLLLRLRVSAPIAATGRTLLRDVGEGWSAFCSIRWVWVCTLSFALMNLVQTGTWQILGPTLTEQLSGKATWGFVLSARGVGLLVASTVLYRLVIRRLLRLGRLVSALGALPLLLLGARLPGPWLVVGGLVSGAGLAVSGISWDTSIQEHVPDDVLSRVASYDDLLSYAAIPVGQLLVGPLAHLVGGFTVVTVAGALFVVVAWAPLASRQVRTLEHGVRAARGG